MIRDDLLPEVYRTRRPLHDDWVFPFSLIPRRWTFWPFPFPPRKVCGSQQEEYVQIQKGYPMAPDARYWKPNDSYSEPTHVLSVHPVGWGWSVQSCPFPLVGRLPCYFQWTRKVLGRKLHFNIGLRPDVTLGDWGWWFPEASLGWTKE